MPHPHHPVWPTSPVTLTQVLQDANELTTIAATSHATDDSAHHAPVTIGTDNDGLLSLSSQALSVNQIYLLLAGGTMTGAINMADNLIRRAKIVDYAETVDQPSILAGTLTLDLETANVFDVTLDANVTTLTISNWLASSANSMTVHVSQDGTGGYTVAWTGILWAGGSAPTVTSTAGATDVFVLWSVDGGATIFGSIVGQDFS